jgi:hypothetical protein
MPVIFNTVDAVTPKKEDIQYVPYGEFHVLAASGLSETEIVAVHIDAPDLLGSVQLFIEEQEIKMTATNMVIRITGPLAYKLVKLTTINSVMVKQHTKHLA